MATGLVNSFLAAIQASLSVLLVISYGGLAAHLQLLTPTNTKAISKVCVRMFLPALLVTKIGGELHAGSAGRYLTVLVWAVACHLVSFLVGVMAHLWLGMPDWTTVAVMFNNTTSYPLLLIAALEQTGILKSLIPSDGGDHGETTSQAVERAKSYFLVFATVSSCLTFAVGPRLIDTEHAADSNDEDDDDEEEPEEDKTDIRDDDDDDDENQNNVDGLLYHRQSGGVGGVGVGSMSTSIVSSRGGSIGGGEDSTERTRLLSRRTSTFSLTKKRQNSFFPSTRTTSIIDWTDDDENSPQSQGQIDTDLLKRRPTMVPVPRRRWIKLTPRTRWWLLFISDFFNAPLLGAILGAFIGLIPPLHRAFFNDTEHGGIFTAWLTSSWQSIGGLFVPLPVVVAGVSLYTAMKEARKRRRRRAGSTHDDDDHDDSDHSNGSLPWGTVTFIMVIRFIIWPAVSISVIYFLAKNTNILGNDPMLWFAMMLMPTGPPAMKLITLVQVSDADEADETNMAKLLTLSYAISPILSFTVVGGLRAAQAAT